TRGEHRARLRRRPRKRGGGPEVCLRVSVRAQGSQKIGAFVAEAFLIDAVRTPVGRRGGALSSIHPADLGAHVIKAVVGRNSIDPALVDDVILGCTDTLGPQAGNIARTAWLAAGFPEHVPGVTIDRQ